MEHYRSAPIAGESVWPSEAHTVAFCPVMDRGFHWPVAVGRDNGSIGLWVVPPKGATGNTARRTQLAGHRDAVRAVAFSSDGRLLASAADDRQVLLWKVDEFPEQATPVRLTGHTGAVRAVAFSPVRPLLAYAGDDRTVILWDLSDPGAPRLAAACGGHGATVTSLAFSPDGTVLVSGCGNEAFQLWNVARPTEPSRLGTASTGRGGGVHAAAVSPTSRILATAGDGTIQLWSIDGAAGPARLGSPLVGHTDIVTSVAFTRDGLRLASASSDHTVRFFDVSHPAAAHPLGEPIRGEGPFRAVAFSPDGAVVAAVGAASRASLDLWAIRDL
ncbi:hypothetical protein CcI49_03620 [Frankia sp. CcI49]|nr:hypothetical protein CcI49_03620 [Frankia sp. CcI49]